jgi:hypothetical protein
LPPRRCPSAYAVKSPTDSVREPEFLSKLGKYGVPAFQMAPEELEEDVTNALQDVRRDG